MTVETKVRLFQDVCHKHTFQQEEAPADSELINIIISSGKQTFRITTHRSELFLSVATSVCEEADWDQNKTRFLLNGSRIQNGKTFSENDIENHALIEVMFEMVGGKGPSEAEILKMLEKDDTGSEDESDELNESSDNTGVGKEVCFLVCSFVSFKIIWVYFFYWLSKLKFIGKLQQSPILSSCHLLTIWIFGTLASLGDPLVGIWKRPFISQIVKM